MVQPLTILPSAPFLDQEEWLPRLDGTCIKGSLEKSSGGIGGNPWHPWPARPSDRYRSLRDRLGFGWTPARFLQPVASFGRLSVAADAAESARTPTIDPGAVSCGATPCRVRRPWAHMRWGPFPLRWAAYWRANDCLPTRSVSIGPSRYRIGLWLARFTLRSPGSRPCWFLLVRVRQ